MIRKKIITATFASIVALSGANAVASSDDGWYKSIMKSGNLNDIFDLLYPLVDDDGESLVGKYREKIKAVNSALRKLQKHNEKVSKHCNSGDTQEKCKNIIKKIDEIIKSGINE